MEIKKRIAVVVFGLIFALFGAVLYREQAKESAIEDRLRRHGVNVVGTVVRQERRQVGSGRSVRRYRWLLSVTYRSVDRDFHRSFRVTEQAFRAHPFGATVPLRIDPDDPGTARIEGGLSAGRSTSSALLTGSIVAMVAGIALLLVGWLVRFREA